MKRAVTGCAFAALLLAGGMQFHADTRLVEINVIVRDKNGPVKGLTKDDFVVADRGKARAISVFSENVSGAVPEQAQSLPENTFSNRPRVGAAPSVTIILLDRLNTLIETRASAAEETPLWNAGLALQNGKLHVLKLIDDLGANDRVAIYSLGESLNVLSDFSSDREQLKSILQKFDATSLTSREVAEPDPMHICPPGDFNGCGINRPSNRDRQALANITNANRAAITMKALAAIAAHVAAIPGRKNLVWITANLPVSGEGVGRLMSSSNLAIYPVDARGLLPVANGYSTADTQSGMIIRGSKVDQVIGSGQTSTPEPPGLNGMRTLADETGGRAFINNNDLTGAIKSAINDGAVTYTLGFYADVAVLDGKFHQLKVRVKRAGVDVRTQNGYFALKDAGVGNADAMTSPLESSAIHVLARVEHSGSQLSVSGSIDLKNLRLEQDADSTRGEVEIRFVQQDASGAVLNQRSEAMHLQLTSVQVGEYLKTGLFFRTLLAPKDGWKTLRILVTDRASGSSGSLIIPASEIR